MLNRIFTFIVVGLVAGAKADSGSEKNAVQVQRTLENIMAKAGISIGGEFKSQYFLSNIDGSGVDTSKRRSETNEFTSVDFDIKARPNESVSGRLIFRMHQNWQNFFSDIANPIFSRWISIDGSAMDMFRFNVGDFRAQFSPLTLYAPEIEILNEPFIFKRQRDLAMNELFLGNNDRLLQGINFGFDAEIAPIFNEFHFALLGSRLRNTETSLQNGSTVTNNLEKWSIGKYFIGTNLDLLFLKGISVGGSWLINFDHKASYAGTDSTADTLAQRTNVFAGRVGVDIASMAGLSNLVLKINGEFAGSNDDVSYYIPGTYNMVDSVVSGAAINLGLDAGISSGKTFNLKVTPAFIMNDRLFRNDMAQSQTFVGQRVMNSDNDSINPVKQPVYTNYSTFDALYHTVFKFVPEGSSNLWVKAPFMKNSYTRAIFTNTERERMAPALDPVLQLVMPYGPATPNRTGVAVDLDAGIINDFLKVSGVLSMLSEKEAVGGYAETKFQQMGGGLKVDFSRIIDFFQYPIEVSASKTFSTALNDGIINMEDSSKWDINSELTNFGVYLKFFKRAAVIAGYQGSILSATLIDSTSFVDQKHWAAGVHWSVADAADIITTVGQIITDYDDVGLPLTGQGSTLYPAVKDTKRWLVDISLRVKF